MPRYENAGAELAKAVGESERELALAINWGKSVFTFAMGHEAVYDFLNDNPVRAERQRNLDQRHDPDRPDRRL
jgi:hypothetical protein